MNEQLHRDACDTEGNTVLHILVKNPVKGEKRMVNILNYLLENGCPPELPDGSGKLPIDFVSPNDAYFAILMRANITSDEGSSTTNENDDVQIITVMDEIDDSLKQGNEYLDRNALNKALEMFLKAKELLLKGSSNGEMIKATLHNVQCLILECQIRKGSFKSAFENALQRLDIEDESPRFLYLLGRSHAGLCNWIEAIASFVRAVLRLQDDNLKFEQDIIIHIAKTYPQYLEITKGDKGSFKVFTKLPTRLKCSIVFQLVIKREWDAASVFFHRFSAGLTLLKDQTVSEMFDLQQLCNIKIISEHLWLTDFIKILVANNLADFRQIILKTKEKYLHACVRIASVTENTNLLELVVIRARACNEENIVDSKGNTPLHLAVQLMARNIKSNSVTLNIVQKLLENGANHLQKNDEGKIAHEYVPMSNAQLCKKITGLEKSATRVNHKELKAKGESMKFKKTKKREPKSIRVPVVFQQNGNETTMSESCENCQCRSVVDRISLRRDQNVEGDIDILINVLQEHHDTSSTHRDVLDECVSLVAETICSSAISEIPTSLAKIDDKLYNRFLQKLIQMERWEVMHDAVVLCISKGNVKSFQRFFRQSLIATMTNTAESEGKLCKIFEHLPEGENIINEDDEELVKSAIAQSHFKVLRLLFQSHVNPKYLSLELGDTPIHVAANMYLREESSTIFQDFVSRYRENPIQYSYLDPHQTDAKGNNLFHLVAKSETCPQAHKLAKLLNGFHVSVSCRNNEGKLPKDYVQCKHEEIRKIFRKMDTTVEEKIEELKEQIKCFILCDNNSSPKKSMCSTGEQNHLEHKQISQMKVLDQIKNEDENVSQKNDFDQNQAKIGFDVKEFDNLLWEIECSPSFLKTMTRQKIPLKTRQNAVHCIKELGEGQRRRGLCKRLKVKDSNGRVLYEIKVDKAIRIIWEIAITFSPKINRAGAPFKGNVFISEVIRIWDIVLDHDNLHRCVKNILKSYSKSKQSQLLHTRVKKEAMSAATHSCSLEKPRIFQCISDVGHANSELERLEVDFEKVCLPLNPNEHEFNITKFYSFSPDVVSHMIENLPTEIDFPFKVTELEHAIINMETEAPILLVGRSGTGKTTCCLYRLWKKFEEYWTFIASLKSDKDTSTINTPSNDGKENKYEDKAVRDNSETGPERHLRQLFVTKNPVLCQEVKRNFLDMKQACRAWRGSCSPRQQDLPQRLQDVEDYQYPLFLTFKQLLKVLDISLGCPFYLAKDDMTMDIQGWADSLNNGDLSKFRDTDLDIEDLLEDDSANDVQVREESDASRCSDLKSGRKPRDAFSRKLLTYEVFEELFWNKIKGNKSECHQSLVWTEIMSFIKGSFQALLSPTGYLDLKQYKELGKKMAPVFTNDREKIYEMFKIYEKVKKQLFYIDEADVARNIFQRMTKQNIPDLLAHEIYVDETQDFTQAELCILVRLCQTPKGLFLTGDTAQCIMRGISFRFEDLRSLFHQIREISERNINVPEKLFHLTHNYRSHAGILNLASGVLEILKEFFPESYDHLERDVGMIDGPKPVILKQSDSKDLILLLAGNERKTSSIDLGAHQVILVASEETKEKIQTEFNKCLVMTIDRAKGLEFDDVLIYNFFKESSATKEWRVVKQFLEKMSKSRNSDRANVHIGLHEYQHINLVPNTEVRPLDFDPRKHKVLCTELKVLYTAITRARSNVWVFDEDKESRAPMYEYFAARNLVDVRDDSSARGFSQPSACSEWLLRGNYFFRKLHFDEAAKCYENAGHSRGAEYASARHHQQQAKCAEKNKKKHHLLAAALRFFNCNKLKSFISCLKNASEFEILAVFYEGRNEIDEAAEMYGRAGMPLQQSKCLENIEYFGKALKVLINSANFDPGLDCLKRFKSHGISKDEIPEDLSDEKKIFIKAMKYCGKAQNIPKMVGYAEKIDDFKTKFEIFLEYDNVEGAFNLKYGKADVVEKIDFFLKCGAASKALELAIENDQEKKKKQIQIQCIVLMAQRAIHDKDNKDERNISKIVDHLSTLIAPEETSENTINTGKAQLLIGQLTKDSNFVETAFQTFKKEKHAGFVGQLECIEWLINNIDLLAFSNFERIIMHIKETVSSLDKEMNIAADLKLWYEFYGYYKENGTNTYKIYPRQCPLAAKMFQTKELHVFEDSLDANNVKNCCLKFWEDRYRSWEHVLLGNLYKRKDTTKGCLKGHFEKKGKIWRKDEKQNTPDYERNSVLQITQLNIMSVELLTCLNILDPRKDRNMTVRCEIFINDLFYTDPLKTTTVKFAEKQGLSKLLHDKRFSYFREKILKYLNITHLDAESKSIGKSIEVLLVKIALGFEDVERYLADMQQFQILENDVNKYHVHREVLTFFNSFEYIRKENTVSAVQCFDTFCAFLSPSEKQQLPMIPEIFILFSELFVSVAFCSVAYERSESFVLPDSFLASVEYCKHVFLGSKSIFETLKKNPPQDSTFMLHRMLQMFCGFSCKMNLIKMLCNLSPGIVDRILFISFISLCNLNLIQSTEQIYEIESVLVKELLDLLESKKRTDILKSMMKATNSSDFIDTLQIIMKPYTGNDLKVCRLDREKGFQTCTGILNVKGVPLRKETLEALESMKNKDAKNNQEKAEKKDQAFVCPEDKNAYSLAFPELPRQIKPLNASERNEL